MKKLILIIGLLMVTVHSTWAAKLDDVKVLGIASEKDRVELKLHVSSGSKDSFFFVGMVKSDAESFEKMALVIKKLLLGDNFKLNLNIKNFSMSPSGSYYPSDSVNFSGIEQE